jgi:hypothetical protein
LGSKNRDIQLLEKVKSKIFEKSRPGRLPALYILRLPGLWKSPGNPWVGTAFGYQG